MRFGESPPSARGHQQRRAPFRAPRDRDAGGVPLGQLEDAVAGLREFSPGGGTSLENAFAAISDFADKPDNLFLLTDGLPTQGRAAPAKYMVTGEQRRRFFVDAVNQFPRGIPVNTILFPM